MSYGGGPVPYGYVPPVEHPSGTTVLVLGILSLVICPVTGIFAITLGNRALREIDARPMVYANRQQIAVGRILGIVAVAVYGTAIVGYLLFALVVVGMIGLGNR
ncbi:MAG: hypothetical protein ACRYG2_13555 [Janthinobacterium lividum]